MHELGIALHIMDQIEDLAKENGLKKIGSVTLEIGEVSGVIFDYLADVWKWAAEKKDLFQGSELRNEEIHALTVCLDCKKTYDTVPQGRQCPHCGSWNTELLVGNELNIKEIEAY